MLSCQETSALSNLEEKCVPITELLDNKSVESLRFEVYLEIRNEEQFSRGVCYHADLASPAVVITHRSFFHTIRKPCPGFDVLR